MSDEKLQKVLARSGYGSRREMERWIGEGRVSVNGRTATLGDRVSHRDQIQVNGRAANIVSEAESTRRVVI